MTIVNKISCPWKDEHKSDAQATSLVFEEVVGGGIRVGFSCMHASCLKRTMTDFVRATGGDTPMFDLPEDMRTVGERLLKIKMLPGRFENLDLRVRNLLAVAMTELACERDSTGIDIDRKGLSKAIAAINQAYGVVHEVCHRKDESEPPM